MPNSKDMKYCRCDDGKYGGYNMIKRDEDQRLLGGGGGGGSQLPWLHTFGTGPSVNCSVPATKGRGMISLPR